MAAAANINGVSAMLIPGGKIHLSARRTVERDQYIGARRAEGALAAATVTRR